MNKDRWQRRVFLLVLIAGVLLRVGAALYLGDKVPKGSDELTYSTLGARLASGYGYSFAKPWYPYEVPAGSPTAHWSFLFTGFVAGLYWLFGVHPLVIRLAGALLGGILLPWMVYRLVRRAIPGRPALAMLAACCAALYAYFILYAAMLMTETLYISALLWSLERGLALLQYLEDRTVDGSGSNPRLGLKFGLELGLGLGAATLLRQSILPWIAVLFALLLWAAYRHARLRRGLAAIGVTCGVLVLCIAPFTIRNYQVFHEFLLLNSNAGYAMYSAQHPLHGVNFQPYEAAPLPPDLDGSPLNEAQWDRALMARGIGFVLADPVRYLRLSLSRVPEYFMFWPSAGSDLLYNLGRVASFGLFLPFILYGMWCSRKEWRRFRLLYIFIVFYSVLHVFTWSMNRYRLPVDAVLLLFAALGLTEVLGLIRASRPAGLAERLMLRERR